MAELKPCPFCGGEAVMEHYIGGGYLAHCSECDGMIENWFEREAEAAEAWNRRAPSKEAKPKTLTEAITREIDRTIKEATP